MVPQRLKSARLRAGYTQEKLGVLAGIDEATARSRISQYEWYLHPFLYDDVRAGTCTQRAGMLFLCTGRGICGESFIASRSKLNCVFDITLILK